MERVQTLQCFPSPESLGHLKWPFTMRNQLEKCNMRPHSCHPKERCLCPSPTDRWLQRWGNFPPVSPAVSELQLSPHHFEQKPCRGAAKHLLAWTLPCRDLPVS